MFIFIFLIHNSHEKFDKQILVLNQKNQIESWKSVDIVLGSNKEFAITRLKLAAQGMAWHSMTMFRVQSDTTQLSRCPNKHFCYLIWQISLKPIVFYYLGRYYQQPINVIFELAPLSHCCLFELQRLSSADKEFWWNIWSGHGALYNWRNSLHNIPY